MQINIRSGSITTTDRADIFAEFLDSNAENQQKWDSFLRNFCCQEKYIKRIPGLIVLSAHASLLYYYRLTIKHSLTHAYCSTVDRK